MRISDWSSDVCSSDLGSGVYVRPYVRLTGRAVSGPGLVKGRRMDALLGLELLDAARGTLLGRAERDGDWTLASRGWDYLPADYRPARRATSPDVRGMIGRLIERSEEHTSELQSLMRISDSVFCLKKKQKQENTTT